MFKGRKSGGITKLKEKYAHDWDGGELKALHEIVAAVKGTAIMGVSGQGQTFTEATCKAVLAHNPRPLIFPMSNPTSKAECSAEQAFKWTNNKCIFASGSPFPRMTVKLVCGEMISVTLRVKTCFSFEHGSRLQDAHCVYFVVELIGRSEGGSGDCTCSRQ